MGATTEQEGMPLWATMFMREMNRRFDEISADLKDTVTKEAFETEKTRINEVVARAQAAAEKAQKAIEDEAKARVTAELAQAQKAQEVAEGQAKLKAATNWQWIALFLVPVLGYAIPWLLRGGMGP